MSDQTQTTNQGAETPEVKDQGTSKQPEIVTTPVNDEQDVEVNQVDDSPQEDVQPKDEDISEEQAKAAMAKMSALERERNELKQKYEQLRQARESAEITQTPQQQAAGVQSQGGRELDWATANQLNAMFRGNPDAYENWRKEWVASGGRDYGPYDEVYNNKNPDQAQQIDVNAIAQTVQTRVSENMEWKSALKEFFKDVPEMDPENVAGDDVAAKQAQEKFDRIAAIADVMRRATPSLSRKESLIAAWNSLPENMGKTIEAAKRAGELGGYAAANASGVGSVGGISGGKTKGEPSKIHLNAQESAYYQKKLKREGKKMADLWAMNLAKSKSQ